MTIEEIIWQVEPRKSLDSEIIRGKIKEALLIQEDYYEKLLYDILQELRTVNLTLEK